MMPKHNRKGRTTKGPSFIQLFHHVKRSDAFQSLSTYARCSLIELLDRYTGCNNGKIGLGVRELAKELNCSKDSASRALIELDDAGLVRPMKVGNWRGKRATEWRLMFYRCDVTFDRPKRNFPASPRPAGGTQSPSGRTQAVSQSGRKDTNAEKFNKRGSAQSGRGDTCISAMGGDAEVEKAEVRALRQVADVVEGLNN